MKPKMSYEWAKKKNGEVLSKCKNNVWPVVEKYMPKTVVKTVFC